MMTKLNKFLNHTTTHHNAVITYKEGDMWLVVHRFVGYLNEQNARRRVEGHHFLTNFDHDPPHNDTVLSIAQIIKASMSSTAEAEISAN